MAEDTTARMFALRLLVACLVGALALLFSISIRQAHLNRMLIEALVRKDDDAAIAALAAGASAATTDYSQAGPSRCVLLQIWDELWRSGGQGATLSRSPISLFYENYPYLAELSGRHVARKPLSKATLLGALLDHGANVNEVANDGISPIWYGIYEEPALLLVVLGHAADTEMRDSAGYTPLMMADVRSSKLLVLFGANVDAIDRNGETVLMHAADDNDSRKVGLLLRSGARQGVRDRQGRIAADYARRFVRTEWPGATQHDYDAASILASELEPPPVGEARSGMYRGGKKPSP